jgi:deaminated glutathione amidase
MTQDTVTIALAQFAPSEFVDENIAAIAALAQEARNAGATMMITPEYSHAFVPGGGPSWARLAQDIDGEFVTALSELSANLEGLVIIAGMLVAQSGGLPINTSVVVGPEGLIARSEKIHLYDAYGTRESDSVTPGSIEAPDISSHGVLQVGVLACYDLRFPEVSRRLVDAGANTVVVPAQWVPGDHKVDQWMTLLRARAIENQCFVLAAGHPGPHGIGHSAVIDPWGQVVASLDDKPGLLVATLEGGQVGAVRSLNPMESARRFSVVPRRD